MQTKFEEFVEKNAGKDLVYYWGDGFTGVYLRSGVGTSGNGIRQTIDEEAVRRLLDTR